MPSELQQLPGDALRFWGDPTWRDKRLRDIVAAANSRARTIALSHVDDAVVQGMTALGLPRAAVRSRTLVMPTLAEQQGAKYATSDLQIGLPALRRELGPGGAPDTVVETWIHESIHGRLLPWGSDLAAEQPYRGFEEGLAEGITRLISRRAGFIPGAPAHGRHVQSYESLADLLGTSPEAIYRRLYTLPNGSVMTGFVSAIDTLRIDTGSQRLSAEQRARLERGSRQLFDIAHQQAPASARARRGIRRTWQRALQ